MSESRKPEAELDRTGLRGAVFWGLTGLKPAPASHPSRDVETMLRAIAGIKRRGVTGVDTARAARLLGVSRRTVERWRTTTGGQRYAPNKRVLQVLERRARQSATTARGRAAALAAQRGTTRAGSPRSPRGTGTPTGPAPTPPDAGLAPVPAGDRAQEVGGRLRIRGTQGLSRAGTFYSRRRQIFLPMGPGDVEGLRSAYVAGGDDAALEWMRGHADATYTSGWDFEHIDDLDLDTRD